MRLWITVLAGVVAGAGAVLLLVTGIVFWCRRHRSSQLVPETTPRTMESGAGSLDNGGATNLHPIYKLGSSRASLRFHPLRRNRSHGHPTAAQLLPAFNWSDHPQLVTEAAENGWSRFAFIPLLPTPMSSDDGEATSSTWDMMPGTAEPMQTMRLDTGVAKKQSTTSSNLAIVRMSLPLPGPPLVGSPFPQEAYFEITITGIGSHQPLPPASRSSKHTKDHSGRDNMKNLVMSLGLTASSPRTAMTSLPGAYPRSVGFHSDGSVYLDGMKLVIESERTAWPGTGTVIGCGYEPGKQKVYFTINAQMVDVINCGSDAYTRPLYAVVASNADASVLVNLGQSRFKYGPANAHRTSNPCFVSPNTGEGGEYENSGDLFSISGLDFGRLNSVRPNSMPPASTSSRRKGDGHSGAVANGDAESDFIEITLEG